MGWDGIWKPHKADGYTFKLDPEKSSLGLRHNEGLKKVPPPPFTFLV